MALRGAVRPRRGEGAAGRARWAAAPALPSLESFRVVLWAPFRSQPLTLNPELPARTYRSHTPGGKPSTPSPNTAVKPQRRPPLLPRRQAGPDHWKLQRRQPGGLPAGAQDVGFQGSGLWALPRCPKNPHTDPHRKPANAAESAQMLEGIGPSYPRTQPIPLHP